MRSVLKYVHSHLDFGPFDRGFSLPSYSILLVMITYDRPTLANDALD